MTPDVLFPACTLAAGALAAQVAGIQTCGWRRSGAALRHRLLALPKQAPSRARRLMGTAALTLLLTSGGLVAYAAQPSAPEQLPAEVVGIVGSGDRLSLEVRTDQGVRTIDPGQAYKDSWTLQRLTNAEATLAKGGETRRVGLNPTGAVTSPVEPPEPPSTVISTASAAELAAQEAASDKPSAGISSSTAFSAMPSARQVAAAYPQRALQAGIGGQSSLSCDIDGGGAVQNCIVLRESPRGEGFGTAALSLAPVFKGAQPSQGSAVIDLRFDPDEVGL